MTVMAYLQYHRGLQILFIRWLAVEDALSILSHTFFYLDKQAKYEVWDEEDFSAKKLASGLLSELQKKSE